MSQVCCSYADLVLYSAGKPDSGFGLAPLLGEDVGLGGTICKEWKVREKEREKRSARYETAPLARLVGSWLDSLIPVDGYLRFRFLPSFHFLYF